ncbi:MAG: transposase, partial [Shimia sp.]|nr:transposase [Shimia sp.]
MPYFHLLFTLPHALNLLAQANPKLIYKLLFHAASQTLLEFGRNPRWLGGEIGITMVLHTWGQKLDQHIHLHCVVTGGALSPDGDRWIAATPGFLFPVHALSAVFRGKSLEALSQLYNGGELRFAGSTAQLTGTGAFRSFLAQLRAH